MSSQGKGGFEGTERFEVRRQLGAGAWGTVYEAYDRELGAVVALKTLERTEPKSLYRFKQEFRELADVVDPHLVTLYELHTHADRWFFTMEMVDGVDFGSYVRPAADTATIAPASDATTELTRSMVGSGLEDVTADMAASGDIAGATPLSEAGLQRLRPVLLQLAEGVLVLHAARKLHRDLKPSNVRVRADGRVVLLDFGLVLALRQEGDSEDNAVAGTPAFMAPEQASFQRVSEASDWYAVGIMLFEALTGVVPFGGRGAASLMAHKVAVDGPAPSSLVDGVPADLDELCRDLLRRDPGQRPDGAEILARLRRGLASATPVSPQPASTVLPLAFIGRRTALGQLHDAYDVAERGKPTLVWVHGESGMGKSRLVAQFVEEVHTRSQAAVILQGHCYQQESVPYKGLDSVVDDLSRFLARLPASEASTYLPRDVVALGQLFPVLRNVPAVATTPQRLLGDRDGVEFRRRAFGALRELFARIAARRPLVITIDDLQWGDDDSGALLGELMQPPDPPPLLLVGTYRSDEAAASSLLRRLEHELARLDVDVHRVEVGLDRLSAEDARSLAAAALDLGLADDDRIERIVGESDGSPFFIGELARHCNESARTAAGGASHATLGQVVLERVGRLPARSRKLLEVVSVAGRPLRRAVAVAAADLDAESAAALAELRSAHLVRYREAGDEDLVAAYHDRIREAIVGSLGDDARRRHHARIAAVLAESPDPAPEQLAYHLVRSGQQEQARPFAVAAAHRAVEALAFDRAAELYRAALGYGGWSLDDERDLRIGLGHSLSAAGRGPEAADAYLAGAELADPVTRRDCRRRAASELLNAGHLERGLAVLDDLLAEIGTALPSTQRRALLSTLWQRSKLRLRGLRWQERAAGDVDQADLAEIDVLQIVARGLSMVDNIRGADFQSRALLASLRVGEPSRVAVALAMEAVFVTSQGGRNLARGRRFLDEAAQIGVRSGSPAIHNLAIGVEGCISYFESEFRRAAERLWDAEVRFRDELHGVQFELNNMRVFRMLNLVQLGAFAELRTAFADYITDARRRGDRYTETTIRRVGNALWLADDSCERARESLEQASWTPLESGYHFQHWWELEARAEIALYGGDAAAARVELRPMFAGVRRSLLLRIQNVRARVHWLWARLILSDSDRADSRALAQVESLAGRLERERVGFARVWGLLLRAAVARRRGDQASAVDCLRAALSAADEHGMQACAAAARLRLCTIVGGDEGRQLRAEADDWQRREGVVNSERMAELLAPGFP